MQKWMCTALVFLCGEIPNTLGAIQGLKTVAIHMQQYEVATKLNEVATKLRRRCYEDCWEN